MQAVAVVFLLLVIAAIVYAAMRKKNVLPQPAIETEKGILQQHVVFYQALPEI